MKNTRNMTIKATVAMTVAALVLSTSMLLTGCGEKKATEPTTNTTNATTATTATVANVAATEATEAKNNTSATQTTSVKATEASSSKSNNTAATEAKNTNTPGTKNNGSDNTTTKPTTAPSTKPTTKPSATTDPHAGQTWHPATTTKKWVVDKDAYSYEEPVYTERQITVCHVCGAEFDTSESASDFWNHIFDHEFAGEGSGYHSEVRKIQTGTRTVNVPEEGHYEEVTVPGYWE